MDRGRRERIAAEVRAIADKVFREPPTPKDALFLGRHPVTDERLYITARELDTHLHICGGSRRGKTNYLKGLCRRLIKRKIAEGEGFSVIDPHGGLAGYVLELCAKAGVPPGEVTYLDLQDVSRVWGVNPLRQTGQDPYFIARCVGEALIQVFDQTKSMDKKTTSRVFAKLGEALLRLNLTLLESRHFLNRGDEDRLVLSSSIAQLPEGDLRSFWEHHHKRSSHDSEMAAMGPSNRLDDLTQPAVLRRMVGQEVSLDFLELMNRGGIALFNTSLGRNTEITTDGQALFNALLVQQFRQAFPQRCEKGARDYDAKKWPAFTLILDEFGSYCTPEFAKTLTEASKFGLRCVFAHHNFAQLRGPDGDETVLSSVLAVPNKIVFGGLPYGDAEALAKHIYLGDIDPDEIKYQQEMVTWDPDVRKVWLESFSESVTHEPTRRTEARNVTTGGSRTVGKTTDPETGREVTQESETTHQAVQEAESVSTADGPITSSGGTRHEAYVNFPQMRIQKGPPIYRSVEEQVFKAAKTLSTNPRGVCVLAREDKKPTLCLVTKMTKWPVSPEQRDEYKALVYDKPTCLTVAAAEKVIEERRLRVLRDATEPRVIPTPDEPASGKKLRKPFKPKPTKLTRSSEDEQA